VGHTYRVGFSRKKKKKKKKESLFSFISAFAGTAYVGWVLQCFFFVLGIV